MPRERQPDARREADLTRFCCETDVFGARERKDVAISKELVATTAHPARLFDEFGVSRERYGSSSALNGKLARIAGKSWAKA